MKKQIPSYIEQRIRRPVPAKSGVVRGSTPVVSFGNALTAEVATLGLNPSSAEFLDKKTGKELEGSERRLATHRSLNTPDFTTASRKIIEHVIDDCNDYFQPGRNPYRKWFDQLEPIVRACGASYYDRSACHLDLVQWATDPTWGNLQPAQLRKRLLDADAPFLIEQLRNENIRLLLVNGMGVLHQLRRIISVEIREVAPINGHGHHDTRIFVGRIFDRVQVVGWSTNIQSGYGVSTSLKNELANRVQRLHRRMMK